MITPGFKEFGSERRRGISLSPSDSQGESEDKLIPVDPPNLSEERWKPPFMPWFETDFQGSQRVRRLHRNAKYIYGDLLRAGWQCDTAPYLPNDDEELRTMCDCSRQWWKKYGPAVKACFTITNDGNYLYHPKMVREFNRALVEHQRKVAAGRSRWGKPITETTELHLHKHQHVHRHTTTSRNKLSKVGDDE